MNFLETFFDRSTLNDLSSILNGRFRPIEVTNPLSLPKEELFNIPIEILNFPNTDKSIQRWAPQSYKEYENYSRILGDAYDDLFSDRWNLNTYQTFKEARTSKNPLVRSNVFYLYNIFREEYFHIVEMFKKSEKVGFNVFLSMFGLKNRLPNCKKSFSVYFKLNSRLINRILRDSTIMDIRLDENWDKCVLNHRNLCKPIIEDHIIRRVRTLVSKNDHPHCNIFYLGESDIEYIVGRDRFDSLTTDDFERFCDWNFSLLKEKDFVLGDYIFRFEKLDAERFYYSITIYLFNVEIYNVKMTPTCAQLCCVMSFLHLCQTSNCKPCFASDVPGHCLTFEAFLNKNWNYLYFKKEISNYQGFKRLMGKESCNSLSSDFEKRLIKVKNQTLIDYNNSSLLSVKFDLNTASLLLSLCHHYWGNDLDLFNRSIIFLLKSNSGSKSKMITEQSNWSRKRFCSDVSYIRDKCGYPRLYYHDDKINPSAYCFKLLDKAIFASRSMTALTRVNENGTAVSRRQINDITKETFKNAKSKSSIGGTSLLRSIKSSFKNKLEVAVVSRLPICNSIYLNSLKHNKPIEPDNGKSSQDEEVKYKMTYLEALKISAGSDSRKIKEENLASAKKIFGSEIKKRALIECEKNLKRAQETIAYLKDQHSKLKNRESVAKALLKKREKRLQHSDPEELQYKEDICLSLFNRSQRFELSNMFKCLEQVEEDELFNIEKITGSIVSEPELTSEDKLKNDVLIGGSFVYHTTRDRFRIENKKNTNKINVKVRNLNKILKTQKSYKQIDIMKTYNDFVKRYSNNVLEGRKQIANPEDCIALKSKFYLDQAKKDVGKRNFELFTGLNHNPKNINPKYKYFKNNLRMIKNFKIHGDDDNDPIILRSTKIPKYQTYYNVTILKEEPLPFSLTRNLLFPNLDDEDLDVRDPDDPVKERVDKHKDRIEYKKVKELYFQLGGPDSNLVWTGQYRMKMDEFKKILDDGELVFTYLIED